MPYLRRRPRWPLCEFAELVWVWQGVPSAHTLERLMPDGCTELVVNLNETRTRIYDNDDVSRFESLPEVILCAPRAESFIIDTISRSVAGVHFKPGGVFPFLAPPVDELQGKHIGLEMLWGRMARRLRERLLEAPSQSAMLDVLEATLMEQALKPFNRHPVVAYALGQFARVPHPLTIGEVTERTGYSARRFIEIFKGEVGLTPKVYCRVRRFQQVLQTIHRLPEVNWTGIAHSCGYYDQAHFIHDFRSFSGLSPSTYAARKTEHLNHVPIG